jgi:hypothetical protein
MAGVAAAGLEGLAVLAAIEGAGCRALALHLGSCGCVAFAVRGRAFEGPAACGLTLGMSVFVPILGALGLVAVALARFPAARSPGLDLLYRRIPGAAEIAASSVELGAVNAYSQTRDRGSRLAKVAAARVRSDPGSVALLRRALGDPDEDVRLLAQALLESKTRAAYRKIHEGARELAAAPAARHAAIHWRLALEHWELAWLGLARGECLHHVLGLARRHALAALETDPARASIHFLLGRIELRRGEAQDAEAALLRAAELGLQARVVQPYLAEAAFLARRFDLVRRRLAEATPAGSSATVDRVRSYWS